MHPEHELTITGTYKVFPHDEFEIGREGIFKILDIQDGCISKHHLRIHCVVYGDDDVLEVAPMVYMKVLSMNPVVLRRRMRDGLGQPITVTNRDGHVLLNRGDSVQLTHRINMVFKPQLVTDEPEFDETCRIESAAFANQYQLTDRILGKGGFAAVYFAIKKNTGQQFACKVIGQDQDLTCSRSVPSAARKSGSAVREVEVLKKLSHPNVISLDKVITTPFSIYVFQELATCGDLLSYMDKKGRLSETQVAVIVKQLLEAVNYLHNHNIVHRDIKPENILMTTWKDGGRLILNDFGHAKTIADFEQAANAAGVRRMYTMVGTVGYIAPGYSKAIDMWSVGCVGAALVTGHALFPDGSVSDEECLKHFAKLEQDEDWQELGHRGKAFIKGCLTINEEQRLTAKQALQMPWFTHPFYKSDFDAAYQHAIADWQPKRPDSNLVEHIDTTEAVERAQRESRRSQHFNSGQATFRLYPNVQHTTRKGRSDELHASPAHIPDTPPPPPQYRSSSEEQETLDSIAHPPDIGRFRDFSALATQETFDLGQAISLPPKLGTGTIPQRQKLLH
ncbi:hypothetical protein AC578_5878 [Pseudocercospora eumusae]|uniref:Protein kinase domain-containing protein n=1 Tax=Pseudocercospora eumusae TaxID=321146 RepID=A0A139HD50_9PEZI|nr:hypothetical protein AC578_5878 [Pseudocercospora eumusae]